MTIPSGLRPLITAYQNKEQGAVSFRPTTWDRALGPKNPALPVLVDEQYTWQDESTNVDRLVDRGRVHDYAAAVDPADDEGLLRAFLLVQVWGAGKTGNRTPRHTAAAFEDRDNLLRSLRTTTELLRNSDGPNALAEAYRSWRCAGVGRSFFTKWFTFAGTRNDRLWQPLIMDDRVLKTLNQTLDVTTAELAGTRLWRRRYQSYVEAVHGWAAETGTDAQRLEWILFRRNGEKMPS